MFIFLSILFGIITFIVGAGITHGYAKHRWPVKWVDKLYRYKDVNSDTRSAATILWPFYWVFVWPFTKTNELTFSYIEKKAGLHVTKNKARIADLRATREQVESSNAELEQAELELEKEIARKL